MEFNTTRNCLEDIMRSMGTLEVGQLERFFRNAPDKNALMHHINMYVQYHVLDFNEAKNRLTYHNFPSTKPGTIDSRITAFWIPAAFGYDNVQEIRLLKYPQQLIFITHDSETYDVTVCGSTMEASNAVRARQRMAVPSIEDDVNHIAIVRTRELGRQILPMGYDSYCILDKDKNPVYYDD